MQCHLCKITIHSGQRFVLCDIGEECPTCAIGSACISGEVFEDRWVESVEYSGEPFRSEMQKYADKAHGEGDNKAERFFAREVWASARYERDLKPEER